jgi:hypothetical protein
MAVAVDTNMASYRIGARFDVVRSISMSAPRFDVRALLRYTINNAKHEVPVCQP